jgi:hypothetical protein
MERLLAWSKVAHQGVGDDFEETGDQDVEDSLGRGLSFADSFGAEKYLGIGALSRQESLSKQ